MSGISRKFSQKIDTINKTLTGISKSKTICFHLPSLISIAVDVGVMVDIKGHLGSSKGCCPKLRSDMTPFHGHFSISFQIKLTLVVFYFSVSLPVQRVANRLEDGFLPVFPSFLFLLPFLFLFFLTDSVRQRDADRVECGGQLASVLIRRSSPLLKLKQYC